ncbi:MAG: TolC family protein [Akkermansiaceae bacterium]
MKIFTQLFVVLIFLQGGSLLAADTLVVSLHSIPDRIRKQNPDLAAARYRIKEALGRMHQSGRKSNPELEIGAKQGSDFRERGISVGISQKFPITARLQLEKQLSLTQVKAAEQEIRDVERRLVADARELLIRTLASRQQRKLITQQKTISMQLADFIGKAAEKGESSVLDAGQAKLEAIQLENEIRQLKAEEVALTGKLKPLLGMSTSALLHAGGKLPTLGTIKAANLNPNNRPDLKAAKLRTKAANKAAELERAKRYDDIEVGISAELERSEDAPDGYENQGSIGFRVKIPLPLHNKNEGAIEEADAKKARREKESQALAQNIRHEASTAHKEMKEWIKLSHEITTNLLPLAEKQSKLTEQAYRNGQGDLQSTLRSREQLLKLHSAKLKAQLNYHLAKNRYHAALAY